MTSPVKGHWPVFENILCGTMSDRERMGLPKFYINTTLDNEVADAYKKLRTHGITELLDNMRSTTTSLAERIASGNLLALVGDPRIKTFEPDMITLSGGDVKIGLPTDQIESVLTQFSGLGLDINWIAKECPQHHVTLKPYRIARYPITNIEYREFLVATHHPELPSSWPFRRFPQERANHPVYTISPESADAYARWLQESTGRAFRLPTEAEWEFAAAGIEAREFPWGNHFDAQLANTAETGLFDSSAVGVFVGGESPFGVSDMAGNVEEYVADYYAAYPNGQFIDDHLVQIHGQYRVARGGSFARFRDLARTRRRHGHNPRSATYAMGFRLAESL